MRNKPNFPKSQMFIKVVSTTNYNEKWTMDTWSKQTQTNPILPAPLFRVSFTLMGSASGGGVKRWNLFYGSSDFYNRIMRKSRDQIYDELLILKCQAGEKAALEELVERWEKRLWHYAYKVTGSDSAAWDIVQETWVGIIKGIRKLGDAAVFPQWAFRILNNKCADWLRKRHLQSKLDRELPKGAQNESDARQNIDIKSESLYAAIIKLSSEQRGLLMLRYHEDFDIGQIAEILGVPGGTVKSRLHRALNQLRQMVERHQND
jgi:RNA polymerase sigma-70 factor, ECF subfamily